MPNYEAAARRAAKRHGIDPDVFVAQLKQESGLREGVTSGAGARDIAQFMPATAKAYGVTLGDGRAADDLDGAARYMADNLKRTGGDIKAALSIYNSGRPDAYKDPGFAGGQTYNYVKTIMGAAKVKAPKATTPSEPATPTAALLSGTPSVNNAGLRQQLVGEFLAQGGVRNPAAVLSLAAQYGQAADVPGTAATYAQPSTSTSRSSTKVKSGMVPLGGSKNTGKGVFAVDGPDPGRLQPELTSYAKQVAKILGQPIVGLDGSTHSKYTVNGNVSEHYTGAATDVFTIGGKTAGDAGWRTELIRAGRAALIAAGMPRAKALKQTGGLFNVGNHQVIFNVDGKQYGGNHLDHLHISTHAGNDASRSSTSVLPSSGASSQAYTPAQPAQRAVKPAPGAPVPLAPAPAPAPVVVAQGPRKERLYAHPQDQPGAAGQRRVMGIKRKKVRQRYGGVGRGADTT